MADEEFSGSFGIGGSLRLGQGANSIRLESNAGGTALLVNSAAIGGASVTTPGLPMTSGKYFTIGGTGGSGGTGANSRGTMIPVLFGAAATLNSMSIQVTGAGDAAGVNRFGIYTDASGMPGTLVADLGTVAADAIATPVLTISQAVTATWYWFCVAAQGQVTTRCTWVTNNYPHPYGRVSQTTPGGTAPPVGYYFDTGYSGALPANAGAPTGSMFLANPNNPPAIWLKAA